eukprot:GHVS01025995.1.p1 GENE.GHVS01025995.1~~GHVS01025995.1.p1  ORF type:complete len:959 (+),score=86.14 GHVS01025995.1:167-3043(+)
MAPLTTVGRFILAPLVVVLLMFAYPAASVKISTSQAMVVAEVLGVDGELQAHFARKIQNSFVCNKSGERMLLYEKDGSVSQVTGKAPIFKTDTPVNQMATTYGSCQKIAEYSGTRLRNGSTEKLDLLMLKVNEDGFVMFSFVDSKRADVVGVGMSPTRELLDGALKPLGVKGTEMESILAATTPIESKGGGQLHLIVSNESLVVFFAQSEKLGVVGSATVDDNAFHLATMFNADGEGELLDLTITYKKDGERFGDLKWAVSESTEQAQEVPEFVEPIPQQYTNGGDNTWVEDTASQNAYDTEASAATYASATVINSVTENTADIREAKEYINRNPLDDKLLESSVRDVMGTLEVWTDEWKTILRAMIKGLYWSLSDLEKDEKQFALYYGLDEMCLFAVADGKCLGRVIPSLALLPNDGLTARMAIDFVSSGATYRIIFLNGADQTGWESSEPELLDNSIVAIRKEDYPDMYMFAFKNTEGVLTVEPSLRDALFAGLENNKSLSMAHEQGLKLAVYNRQLTADIDSLVGIVTKVTSESDGPRSKSILLHIGGSPDIFRIRFEEGTSEPKTWKILSTARTAQNVIKVMADIRAPESDRAVAKQYFVRTYTARLQAGFEQPLRAKDVVKQLSGIERMNQALIDALGEKCEFRRNSKLSLGFRLFDGSVLMFTDDWIGIVSNVSVSEYEGSNSFALVQISATDRSFAIRFSKTTPTSANFDKYHSVSEWTHKTAGVVADLMFHDITNPETDVASRKGKFLERVLEHFGVLRGPNGHMVSFYQPENADAGSDWYCSFSDGTEAPLKESYVRLVGKSSIVYRPVTTENEDFWAVEFSEDMTLTKLFSQDERSKAKVVADKLGLERNLARSLMAGHLGGSFFSDGGSSIKMSVEDDKLFGVVSCSERLNGRYSGKSLLFEHPNLVWKATEDKGDEVVFFFDLHISERDPEDAPFIELRSEAVVTF